MVLKVLLLASLVLAPIQAAAVSYTFTLEWSPDRVFLEPEVWQTGNPPFYARPYTAADFEPILLVQFEHEGDLAGLVLDLSDLSAVSGSTHVFDFSWGSPEGTITFGADAPVHWSVGDSAPNWGHSFGQLSEPEPISDWYVQNTANPELLPEFHYGWVYSEPDSWMFYTTPGRWTHVVTAPVPASAWLLLGALTGLGLLRRASPA